MKLVLMKSTLSLAVVALFAAGCSSNPSYEASNDYQSAVSYVGPTDYQSAVSYIGPTDANGAPAETGANGPTGIVGYSGAQGNTGMVGLVDQTGAQGYTGSTGAVGSSNPSWNYTFTSNSDVILRSDSGKTREIASYMSQNPSSRITLNGPSNRYINSVFGVLQDAGVPTDKIQTGVFTDPNLNNDPRVDVLVSN